MSTYSIFTLIRLISKGHELVLDLKNSQAYIWTKEKNIFVPFKLAQELSYTDYFRLDSGDDEFDTHAFVFDWVEYRDAGIRGIQPQKELYAIFNKYDSSNQPITSITDLL